MTRPIIAPIVTGMENITAGQVVFHKRPLSPHLQGPGTVLKVEHDEIIDVDLVTVLWQSAGVVGIHSKFALKTLAEKHAQTEDK